MKNRTLSFAMTAVAVLALLITACGKSSAATGSIEIRVTDAPPGAEVTSVSVTVSGVEIHKAGLAETDESGWISMKLSGASTFDLLQIKGLEQVLATGDLAAGTYTQIRMAVTRVQVTLKGGNPQDATIPSGKLKFVQSFDVVAGKSTVLLFDFDAAKSVNVTGNDKVMFKPVIKLDVTKTPGTLQITASSLPNGGVGVAYNTTLAAMGGTAPYTWSVSTGTLPAGLSLNATTGAITGNPAAAGDSTFTVQVQDNSTVKRTGTRSFTVNIAAAGALQITSTSLPEGTLNADYGATVQAIGGTTPLAFTISAGTLPAGLTLNGTTGAISGTPTAKGDFTFTLKVTDAAATPNSDAQSLALHIAKAATE